MAFPGQLAGSRLQHPLSRSAFPEEGSPPAVPDKDTYQTKALPSPPPPTPTMQHLSVPRAAAEGLADFMPERLQEQARSAQNEPFPTFDYCSDGGASREDQIERIDEEVRKSSWVLNGDLDREDRHASLPANVESMEGKAVDNPAAKEKKIRTKWFQVWRPKT